jgi:hypothetical protein
MLMLLYVNRTYITSWRICRELDQNEELFAKLGKCTRGKGCIYIKRLSDIHKPTLEQLVQESVRHMVNTYPPKQDK